MATLAFVNATNNADIDGLLSGRKWSGTITYSFPDSPGDYITNYSTKNEPTTSGFSPSPSQMQAAITYAVGLINSYTNANIQYAGTNGADIMVAQSPQANPTSYAYYPSSSASGGDVWFGTAYNYSLASLGNYYFATALHELGHAVGLKHSQETGGVANVAVPSVHDDSEYTVMSYRSYVNAPLNGYTAESYGFPQTYMANDILALQTLYGANYSTQSSNTVYTWSPTTGQQFINGVGQPIPGGGTAGSAANRIFETVWDGGGIDTYDLSNYTTNLTLNLNPGAASVFSSTQIAYLGDGHYASGNVYNAYLYNNDARSYIDNATGGSGNDTIIGNAIANVLNGGGGVDSLWGGGGADTFVFRPGDSSASAGQHDRINDFIAGDKIDVSAIDGIPGTAGIDLFRFLGTAAFDGVAGALNYAYNSATNTTTLYGYTNSDQVADFAIDLTGNIALTMGDLVGAVSKLITVTPTMAQAVQGGAAVAVLSGAPTIVDVSSTTLSSATIKVSAAAGNIFPGDQLFINGAQSGTVAGGLVTVSWNDNTKILTLSGVASLATYQTLLSQITYQWTGVDGSVGQHTPHQLTWTVNDGAGSFGTTSVITIERPPVATATNVTLNPNATTVAASSLLTTSDPDGDPIAVYAFKNTGNGHFWLNGVVQPNNQEINVTAAQLSQLTYQSGGGTDSVQARVSDGTLWSSWQSFTVTGPAATVLEAAGSTNLVQVGNNYYLGMGGPLLKYIDATITSGSFAGWAPIGVERVSDGGYEVAWRNAASGQYSVWHTDSNGNFDGLQSHYYYMPGPGNSPTLQALEPSFQQDLNGDGTIGFIGIPIESNGSTSLVQFGSNYFLNGAGGISVQFSYLGSPVTAGQFSGWAPIGVERVSDGGYEVAWRNAASGLYSVWHTDSSGNFDGLQSHYYYTPGPGNSPTLQALEPSFQQDLNGDGTIGSIGTTIESTGSTSLVQVGSNYFLNSAGGISVQFSYLGSPVTAGQFSGWAPIGVERVSDGGYEVAWRNAAAGVYSAWHTDSSGNFDGLQSHYYYAPGPGNNPTLQALEPSFQQDLNGDGTIGLIGTTIESIGSTSLVQAGNNYFLNSAGGISVQFSYLGSPVTVSQFSGWAPIGVERVSDGGYEVAWRNAASGLYSVWHTDSSGNFDGLQSHYYYLPGPGNSTTLQALEPSFQQDLNGDGTIGIPPSPAGAAQSLLPASGSDGFNFDFSKASHETGEPADPLSFLSFLNGVAGRAENALGAQLSAIVELSAFDTLQLHAHTDEIKHSDLLDLMGNFLLR